MHPDGRVQRLRPAIARPGEVRAEWQVLAELALRLGLDLDVLSGADGLAAAVRRRSLLRRAHARGDRRTRRALAGARSGRGLPGARDARCRRHGGRARGAAARTPPMRPATAPFGTPPRSSARPRSSSCPRRTGARLRGCSPLVGYFEPWWIQIIKAIVIFAVGLQLVPVVLIAERKLLGRFQGRYGPNRVGPVRRAAAARRHPQAAHQGAVPADHVRRAAVRARAADLDPHRGGRLRDHPLRGHPGHLRHESRPVRRRRVDRAALRFRLRRGRLLRDHARRLVLGLEVLLPRRHARRRPADLLRGLPGSRARRRDHHRADALADRNRPCAGWHVVLRPAVLRLPRSSSWPASPRPTARPST